MTIKPKAARALRGVRERLRDAAAATHAAATTQIEVAADELANERDRLGASFDGAERALQRARSVSDLHRVRLDVDICREDVGHATTRHDDAIAAAVTTAGALRERTRQLRTAERIVELVDKARFDVEARAERIACDDLAARRR